MDRWHEAEGQERARPLSHTLRLALEAGRRAGVTRLADVSGLTPFGVPVFQAVRPLSRSLSVSQGKGLTPMAAKVSALLEAAEFAVAERLCAPDEQRPLAALDAAARDAWATALRPAEAIRLDPLHLRGWMVGRCLVTGRQTSVPWDLLSLDYTRSTGPDAFASSSGLATGNTQAEAAACAVAELLERDLTTAFWGSSRRERRACEVDPNSVDDPALRSVMARISRAGYDVRLWSIGTPAGIAALRCALVARGARPVLPPTVGSGCHPSRRIATLRAVLEAVQVHATLAAGARDDLEPEHYVDPDGRRRDLLFETLSLARPDRAWSSIPDELPLPQSDDGARSLDRVLAAATRRTALPLIGLEHPGLVAGLTVFRVVAPGLRDLARKPSTGPVALRLADPPISVLIRIPGRPVVFVGPSLRPGDVPATIEARPPATAGDLAALLADPPPAVGLIDGCFETSPTVWHKEILHLLAAGVPVLGAASLGALRAAELDTLGMTGIGCIYAGYRDGRIVRDDAVMLPHAPPELGCRPLGVSLVDAEAALAGVAMPAADRRRLLRIMRRMFHADRNWTRCLALFEAATGGPAPVTMVTLKACPSIKRADALALLAALPGAALPVPPPMPPLTSNYRALLVRVMPAPR